MSDERSRAEHILGAIHILGQFPRLSEDAQRVLLGRLLDEVWPHMTPRPDEKDLEEQEFVHKLLCEIESRNPALSAREAEGICTITESSLRLASIILTLYMAARDRHRARMA